MNTNLKNPYVGPRTFQKEDRDLFFGRDREARDLMALLSTERLVLFYAQSGAGKSSLLNTRLIPELEENDFEVLPAGRIQGDLSAEIDVDNIYIYNLMSSIVQQEVGPKVFENTTLSQFLALLVLEEGEYLFTQETAQQIEVEPGRRILIVDQFEEIFTTHLDAWKKRDGFFRQLAQAMKDDPLLTVLLVMREDYIASLDLYAHLLPGGLRTRYYMQRLTRDMALKAVKNPVECVRPFADGVAEKLVEDLSSILVHKPGDVQELHSGQYVEPLQLQVVCYSLWESLPSDGGQITENDLLEVGDVDQSLERFYDQRVTSVSKEKDVPERVLREWFGQELITGTKTRNMVLQKENNGDSLRDDVIQSLRGDLVQAELRAGQIWYELSHDRLIEPILASNAKWFEQHLSMFQRRVVLWTQQEKSESLLLRGKELEVAEQEAATLALTADEQEFLEDCRVLKKREQRDKTQRRIIGIAFLVSLALLVTTVIFYQASAASFEEAQISLEIAEKAQAAAQASNVEAINQKNKAEEARIFAENQEEIAKEQEQIAKEQANRALASSLAAQADAIKNSQHGLALLLGMEAYQRDQNSLLTRSTLFHLLQFSPYTRLFGFGGPVTSIAVSPDGKWAAVASREQISVIYLETKQFTSIVNNPGMVNSLAFNQDESLLVAGGCAEEGCSAPHGLVTVWDISKLVNPAILSSVNTNHTDEVKAVAFSPDGRYLASGSYDRTINLWDVSPSGSLTFKQTLTPPGQHEPVTSLAFSPDGSSLVAGEADGSLHVWNAIAPPFPEMNVLAQHMGAIYSLAFGSAGSGKFASASDDNMVILWDWDPAAFSLSNPRVLVGHAGKVRSVAFNGDGTVLASAGFDDVVILWNAQTGERIGPALHLHQGAINAVAFGRDTTRDILFSGSDDYTVLLWDLSTRRPLSQPLTSPVFQGVAEKEVAMEGIWALTEGQQIILQNNGQEQKVLSGHTGLINSLSFSPQRVGERLLLASASLDQTVILWDVSSVPDAGIFLKLEGFNEPVIAAYFSQDGKQLITIERDAHTTLWSIDPAGWLDLGCKAVHRNLSPSEWEQYFLPGQEYHKTCETLP